MTAYIAGQITEPGNTEIMCIVVGKQDTKMQQNYIKIKVFIKKHI
jgi:hypothetical protein